MKTILHIICERSRLSIGSSLLCGVLLALTAMTPSTIRAAETATTFATANEAVTALGIAVKAQDARALRTLFGPAFDNLQNPDRVQATNEFEAFAAALDQTNRLVRESDARYVLEMGTNSWPFPVPIVQRDGRWLFDTAAGTEELLNRRIGRNELEVLQVMRAYVDAQREYSSRDRDDDEVLEYAQHLASSPGKTDGLFWSPDLNGEISPLGPLVADAQVGGYDLQAKDATSERAPFHGYYFKILTRQGKNAPGGKYDYIINGNMIAGFAMVAWPADYGHSGIMTFIVNQQGRVYQKDLGPKTVKQASGMKIYDPDPTWAVSAD
jgi:hypothetical protein